MPRTWKVARGSLPTGIRLNKSTGALTGKARRIGIARLVAEASDRLGAVSRASLVVRVTR